MKGTVVVEETLHLPIYDVLLRHGKIWFLCRLEGPLAALPEAERQYVVYGEDGIESHHARMELGWPFVTGTLVVEFSLAVIDSVGSSPW